MVVGRPDFPRISALGGGCLIARDLARKVHVLMAQVLTRSRALAATPTGRKAIRYSLVSVVAVAVNQAVLALAFDAFGWTAASANVLATVAGTIPSYVLSRRWVWRKTGRSHLMKEIVPFALLGLAGLVLTTLAAAGAERFAEAFTDVRHVQAAIVMAATLGTFGVLWVMRYVILDRILFRTDGRVPVGLPGAGGRPAPAALCRHRCRHRPTARRCRRRGRPS